MDKETILRKVKAVPFWWHHIELGHGIVTPGHQGGAADPLATRKILANLHLPEDMSGKTVLDIGAWDGFFSFEAEKRGASYVLAIDNLYRLEKEGKHLDAGIRGFETAKEILGSKVEYKILDVLELSPAHLGRFDLVIFLNVLYHLRHPLLALERIAEVAKEMLVLKTYFTNRYGNNPVAVFYENDELNKDPTNWWGPSQGCLEAMVRSAGFRKIKRVFKSKEEIVLHAFK